jgi:hypothetical protein
VKLRKSLVKFVSGDSPKEERLAAAQGLVETTPQDLVTVLFLLSHDTDTEVSRAAKRSFEELTADTISSAVEAGLDPVVLEKLTAVHGERAVELKTTPRGERLEKTSEAEPAGERAEEKADEPEPGPEDPETQYTASQDEVEELEELSLVKQIENMTVGQKVKMALTGDQAERVILIKDSNKQIATSVLKNPRITEDEVLKLTSTKGTPDKEWVKNYQIKSALVTNPRTPLRITLKFLSQLNDKDLKSLSRSKNIPNVLAASARKTLQWKKKH